MDLDYILSYVAKLNYTKKIKNDIIEYVITKRINPNYEKTRNDTNEKRLDSLQRSARNIRNIIDNNLEFNDLILTLTFKENMINYDISYMEFKKFIKRLKYKYGDFEYISVKELQTDFAIKAISSHGFGWLWNAIPLIRFFSTTKYIYYENNNSAVNGLLPFHAKGVVNDTIKHGLLTAGQATKEVYEAQHGNIRYGRIFQLKKNINYDTRYFHQVVFNEKAPKN
jgi:hypothetical protein